MAAILGLFAVYALIRYFFFAFPHLVGERDIMPILLASQFVLVLSLLVIVRAQRDGRTFEMFFAAFVVMPLGSVATDVGFRAAMGMPISLNTLASTSYVFSPLTWMAVGVVALILVMFALLHWLSPR